MEQLLLAFLASAALFVHVKASINANVPFEKTKTRNEAIDANGGDSGIMLNGRYFACREGSYKSVKFSFYCVGDTQQEADAMLNIEIKKHCAFVDNCFAEVA